jgi:predicted ATP-dependent endonuclease of OLD family
MAEKLDRILHISHVHIEGYKSIDKLDIDLLPGLNILIGENGSGKSNFLEALEPILYPSRNIFYTSCYLVLYTQLENQIKWVVSQGALTNNAKNEFPNFDLFEELLINNKVIYSSKKNEGDIIILKKGGKINKHFIPNHLAYLLQSEEIAPPLIKKVDFGLPKAISYLANPGNIGVYKSGSYSLSETILSEIPDFAFKMAIDRDKISKENIASNLNFSLSFKKALRQYSPITDIRFSKNFNVYDDGEIFRIENIYVEFKINDKWIPWSYLSDGTKRLFYLIYSVKESNYSIILIEEPELGIHPHQFFEILNFLKEESKNKQIIISTHSPEALNILGPEELDRIIITKYDPKKGTTMKHLSPAQKKKAKIYMEEENSLSDYWMNSDLEG